MSSSSKFILWTLIGSLLVMVALHHFKIQNQQIFGAAVLCHLGSIACGIFKIFCGPIRVRIDD
ncbi:hypothetical protein HMPREF2568_06385 [Neisseria sp. HMSC059F02]|jgi:hypothetical protein|nr:hypothetical protein HMPREF2568_06385 [Neisseria sp. HMSC059F02]